MSKIKICGLKRIEDINYVNECKPDYIGFVFAGTKRKISFEKAVLLKSSLSKDIKAVGVFVNEPIENIIQMTNRGIIDIIQLHGDEDEDYIKELKSQTDKPIIKAIRVKDKEDIYRADELNVEYLLLDTYSKDEYGGSGIPFNHDIIPKVKHKYFLAGGININNIKDVIASTDAYCIDVSSSVESDGIKDYNKIKDIIDAVRR